MGKPRLLDLFSGAGGAAMGYARAGFEVVGVDINPQPNYPFEFHQGDALEILADWSFRGHDYFDAIHASPPCQAYSVASQSRRNSGHAYSDLLGPTRNALLAINRPWVIENVPGAPMRIDYRLCGCQFGLELRRERWFETSWHGFKMRSPCQHNGPVVSVVGTGTPTWVRETWGKKHGHDPRKEDYQQAMGIDWMSRAELSQAIPPAYTEFVGMQLLEYLNGNKNLSGKEL